MQSAWPTFSCRYCYNEWMCDLRSAKDGRTEWTMHIVEKDRTGDMSLPSGVRMGGITLALGDNGDHQRPCLCWQPILLPPTVMKSEFHVNVDGLCHWLHPLMPPGKGHVDMSGLCYHLRPWWCLHSWCAEGHVWVNIRHVAWACAGVLGPC